MDFRKLTPDYISQFITEDPDIFIEEMAPGSGGITSDNPSPNETMRQREESQKDAQQKLEDAKRKSLEPQFDAMDSSLKKLDQEIDQTTQAQQEQENSSNEIDAEVDIIANLLKNFRRTIQ